MAKSFLQKMVEDGKYEGSVEILVGAINDKEITISLDECLTVSKLTKKISIPDCKKYIKAGLLSGSVESYQDAGFVRAGTVGGEGRSAGPVQFIQVGDAKAMPKLYFKWDGDKAEDADLSAVEALRTAVQAVFAEHCTVETKATK
ncbi:MAG: hypothetical protein HOG49_26795 [Candidatus Scalindua sp.]|jgi:hypothetical protein|nr:hypothetical protein [Candidatus Scalindua sp.]